jgi:hypothetical protein
VPCPCSTPHFPLSIPQGRNTSQHSLTWKQAKKKKKVCVKIVKETEKRQASRLNKSPKSWNTDRNHQSSLPPSISSRPSIHQSVNSLINNTIYHPSYTHQNQASSLPPAPRSRSRTYKPPLFSLPRYTCFWGTPGTLWKEADVRETMKRHLQLNRRSTTVPRNDSNGKRSGIV